LEGFKLMEGGKEGRWKDAWISKRKSVNGVLLLGAGTLFVCGGIAGGRPGSPCSPKAFKG
jgi:hypothetical protein